MSKMKISRYSSLRACLVVLGLLLLGTLHAQTPDVDCVPIQGQGWQGCAPVGNAQQPSARWENRWGAIATYESNGSLGIATNMTSQSAAQQTALADCQSKHGSTCKLETTYRNGCAALIGSTTGYVVTSDATSEKAIQAGMQTCNKAGYTNCHTYYSACSLPVQVQ